jgi:2,3-bisphosphoglycerate-dependent phosphoglycerate mutase
MRLYFIRHGQSENNALWDATGSSNGRSVDPEITTIGREQARLLAEFVLEKDTLTRSDGKDGEPKRDFFGVTHLYTSLMVRSVATASYLARALEISLVAWPEIHECGGIYQEGEEKNAVSRLPGKTRSYFERNYQDLVLPSTVTEEGWWNRPFESLLDRALRAQDVIDTLLKRHGGTTDRVAIVSHGGFYMELMRLLFKIGEDNCWFMMNNTGVSRFDFRDNGEISLIYHNRTDHLPERLIT